MAAVTFKRAVKRKAKARAALMGPGGSGKTMSMLILLRTLVGPEGRIACIDTEKGSMSKYAHTDTCGGPGVCTEPDHFDFDVVELDSFTPENFISAIEEATRLGYDGFGCDSLSHFWIGQGGALEFVDNTQRAAKSRDAFNTGWKDWRPHEQKMISAMTGAPMHIVVTMRVKTEYAEQTDPVTQRKKRVKIGLQPVQREGLEYEFDIVGAMDTEGNDLVIDKSRCYHYNGKVINKPQPRDWQPLLAWLGTGAEALPPPPPAPAEPMREAPRSQQRQAPPQATQAPKPNAPDPAAMDAPEELRAGFVQLRRGDTNVSDVVTSMMTYLENTLVEVDPALGPMTFSDIKAAWSDLHPKGSRSRADYEDLALQVHRAIMAKRNAPAREETVPVAAGEIGDDDLPF